MKLIKILSAIVMAVLMSVVVFLLLVQINKTTNTTILKQIGGLVASMITFIFTTIPFYTIAMRVLDRKNYHLSLSFKRLQFPVAVSSVVMTLLIINSPKNSSEIIVSFLLMGVILSFNDIFRGRQSTSSVN